MTRILVAPTAFKGTLSPTEVAQAIAAGLRCGCARRRKRPHIFLVPLSDGGDGTVETLHLALGGEVRHCQVEGAVGQPAQAKWLSLGRLAVVELASACGIGGLSQAQLQPMSASTVGLGQVLEACLLEGVSEIVIALGGSASTDGGAGCLFALGARFFDEQGRELPPGGGGMLSDIRNCDLRALAKWSSKARFTIISDVENPLLSDNGAAAVYAPQKGASGAQVEMLQSGLLNFADVLEAATSARLRDLPGAGAAGGTAFGLAAALTAEIVPGFQWIADKCRLTARLEACDLIISGEGRFDSQSLKGKVIGQLLKATSKGSRRIWVIAAAVENGLSADELGIERLIVVRPSHGQTVSQADIQQAMFDLAAQI